VLETERLVLRRIADSDAEDLYAFRSDAEVQLYNGGVMTSAEESVNLIRQLDWGFEQGTGLHWGLTVRGEDKVVGLFGYSHIAMEHRRSEVGYSLARPLWGHGFALEAMQAILNFGFVQMDLNRIYAVPYTVNVRSTRLLERLGFHLEGVHRQEFLIDGTFYDESIYSVLRSEFTHDVS